MRNVDAAGKVRADLDDFQADFPGTSAVVTDQGLLSIRAERGSLASHGDFIDAAEEFAGQRGLTAVARARAVAGAAPYLLTRGFTRYMTPTENNARFLTSAIGADPVEYFWAPDKIGVDDTAPMYSRTDQPTDARNLA